MNLIIIILLLSINSVVKAVDLTITATGLYQLGDTFNFVPAAADNAITIASSDVILDLGGRVLIQGNNTAGVTGIVINSGLTNVTIRNGVINGFSSTGILVNSNCSKILLQNLSIENCLVRGIDFAGAAAPNQIVNSKIQNCNLFGCATSTTGDIALRLLQCNKCQINNCIIADGGNSTVGVQYGIQLNGSTNCDFDTITIENNTATNQVLRAFGFVVTTITQCSFTNCIIRNNSANSCFAFTTDGVGAISFCTFKSCSAIGNSATVNSTGFFFQGTCQNNLLIDCNVIGNSATNGLCIGFNYTVGAGTAIQNTLINCNALGNSAAGAANNAYGFFVNGANSCIMMNCTGSNNSSAANIAAGLSFENNAGDTWQVINCQFNRNNGSVAANGFGIRRNGIATDTDLFTRNIGFNDNSTSASNQLSGVQAGSTSNVAAAPTPAQNLNSVTVPWTNISVSN